MRWWEQRYTSCSGAIVRKLKTMAEGKIVALLPRMSLMD
jgi:hypothetical protein